MRSRYKIIAIGVLYGSLLFSCKKDKDIGGGSSTEPKEESACGELIDQNAKGKLFGKDFVVNGGYALTNFQDEKKYRVTLTDSTIDDAKITFSVLKETGEYDVDGEINPVVFREVQLGVTKSNQATPCGEIIVNTITSDTIKGSIVTKTEGSDNSINGSFSVSISN